MVSRIRAYRRARGRTRLRIVAAIASACALGCLLVASTGPALGASVAVTITANVPSAIALTNNCTASPGWNLGTVLPGSNALTATGAGVCSMTFQSANDTAMLRLFQSDATGTAMASTGVDWTDQSATSNAVFNDVSAYDQNTVWTAGRNGQNRTTSGGTTWTSIPIAACAGGNWVDSITAVPGDPLKAYAACSNQHEYYSSDGGSTWVDKNVGAANTLNDTVATDVNNVWIVTWQAIYHTSNGSNANPTWNLDTITGGYTKSINYIDAADATHLVAGGSDALFFTNNGTT